MGNMGNMGNMGMNTMVGASLRACVRACVFVCVCACARDCVRVFTTQEERRIEADEERMRRVSSRPCLEVA